MVPDRRAGRHRRYLAAAVGCLIGLAGGGIRAEAIGGPPVTKGGQAVASQTARQTQDDQQQASPSGLSREVEADEKASRTDCGDPEECRAEQRDYSDLRAQWQAAKAARGQETYALWQTIIAAVATSVGLVGTGLVYYTFVETRRTARLAQDAVTEAREANRQSRETWITDQRAWLSVAAGIAGPMRWDVNGVSFNFAIQIENVGRTPALNIYVSIKTIVGDERFELEKLQLEFADNIRASEKYVGFNLFPGEKTTLRIETSSGHAEIDRFFATVLMGRADIIMPHMIGCVDYDLFGNNGRRQTGMIYQIIRITDGRPLYGISKSAGDVPQSELRIFQWHKPGRTD